MWLDRKWNIPVMVFNTTFILFWICCLFGLFLPYHEWWQKIWIFLIGWYVMGVIAGILYEAETYAWSSEGSMWRPWFPILAILTDPFENFAEGHLSLCLSPWMLFYPILRGWELPATFIPGAIWWVLSPKHRKEFREEEARS